MSRLTVSFVEEDGTLKTLEAIPGQTLMEVGRDNSVAGILADCGGNCSCATCHVYVDEAWTQAVGPADHVEMSVLDLAGNVARSNSRLSCQIRLTEALDGLKVTVAPAA